MKQTLLRFVAGLMLVSIAPQPAYAKGSFKSWVVHTVRWHISDKLRKKRDNAG